MRRRSAKCSEIQARRVEGTVAPTGSSHFLAKMSRRIHPGISSDEDITIVKVAFEPIDGKVPSTRSRDSRYLCRNNRPLDKGFSSATPTDEKHLSTTSSVDVGYQGRMRASEIRNDDDTCRVVATYRLHDASDTIKADSLMHNLPRLERTGLAHGKHGAEALSLHPEGAVELQFVEQNDVDGERYIARELRAS
jgi:hypothetical protein